MAARVRWLAEPPLEQTRTRHYAGWLLLDGSMRFGSIQMRIGIIPYVSVYFNRRVFVSKGLGCFGELRRMK
jgi:hypothetical protein